MDFSSTLAWPNARPLAEAHTLTMWMACLPRVRSWERRTVLPSMATTSPWVSWATAWTHSIKQRWNCSGSSRAKTSPKVSWEGIPLGSSRKVLNHSSLQLPKSSISTQLSAPQIVPQMAIDTISKRWCRLVRSILGSSNAWKYSTKGAPIASTITTPPQFRNHSYYFKQILNC